MKINNIILLISLSFASITLFAEDGIFTGCIATEFCCSNAGDYVCRKDCGKFTSAHIDRCAKLRRPISNLNQQEIIRQIITTIYNYLGAKEFLAGQVSGNLFDDDE